MPTMTTHLVLSKNFDVAKLRADAAAGLMPRHVMFDVADALDARLWFLMQEPSGLDGLIDRLLGKITGTPGMWPTLRGLAAAVETDDVVFSPEIFGFVFTVLCRLRRKRPLLVLDVMAPKRPRVKFALGRPFFTRRVDHYFVNNQDKVDWLASLGIDRSQVSVPPDVTDERFMVPAPHTFDPGDPVVVSAGREQRDYVTLAEAVRGTTWRTRVCAVSANVTRKQAIAMPEDVPPNMELRHFDWPEYQELFQQSDVVVVPLLEHDYSAGLTVIYEAFAFRKPVIVTQTIGTIDGLVDAGLVIGVPVGDPEALADAIAGLLADDDARAQLAERGHRYFLANATTVSFVDWMVKRLDPVSLR